MNLIDLALISFHLLVGLLIGGYSFNHFGWTGFMLGTIAGFFLSFFSLNLYVEFLGRAFKIRPKCKNGKCDADDYNWVKREGKDVIFRCNCGDVYIKNGRRFYQCVDSMKTSYMRKNIGGQWVVDTKG